MKKKGLLVLGVAGLFSLCATSAMAAENITVMVNGENLVMEQAPVSQNNRTLVPMRAIFEALDAKVDWDGQTQAITATKDDLTVKMAINQKDMTVNEETITLDAAPTLVNDSTMVPVRAVAESFNATVNWDEANQQVIITTTADEDSVSTPDGKLSETVKAEDGTELITIEANYPVLENEENANGINTINAAFKKMAEDYVTAVKNEYQEEVEAFYLKEQNDFTAYTFEMNVELGFDGDNILSGVVVEYANTGGAHPNTIKTGFAYDKTTGEEMALTDIMVGTETEIQEK